MTGWFARLSLRFGRQTGVRARSTLVAVVVVGLALAAGGTGLVVLLQYNLEQSAKATGQARLARPERPTSSRSNSGQTT